MLEERCPLSVSVCNTLPRHPHVGVLSVGAVSNFRKFSMAAASGPVPGRDFPTEQQVQERKDVGKCTHWMARKRRFCGQPAVKPHETCIVHAARGAEEIEPASKRARGAKTRIPCPFDPNHDVWSHRMQRHLRLCPAVQRFKAQLRLPFVVPGVNLADPTKLTEPEPLQLGSVQDLMSALEALERAYRAACSSMAVAETLPAADFTVPPEALSHAARHSAQHDGLLDLALTATEPKSCTFVEMGAGKGGLALALAKHPHVAPHAHVVMVDSGAFRHTVDPAMRKMAAAQPPLLRAWGRLACDISDLWLPGACLSAVDGVGGESTSAERRAPGKLVFLAKHLCGAGTDVALRAMQHAMAWQAGSPPPARTPGRAPATYTPPDAAAAAAALEAVQAEAQYSTELKTAHALPPVFGVTMATCCHHRCTWSGYVAREWWASQLGLSPAHFRLAATLSSLQASAWGVLGGHCTDSMAVWLDAATVPPTLPDAAARADVGAATIPAQTEHDSGPQAGQGKEDSALQSLLQAASLPPEAKLYWGRLCKRLIDLGRVHFLRCQGAGAKADLRTYCSGGVTLENVALQARFPIPQ